MSFPASLRGILHGPWCTAASHADPEILQTLHLTCPSGTSKSNGHGHYDTLIIAWNLDLQSTRETRGTRKNRGTAQHQPNPADRRPNSASFNSPWHTLTGTNHLGMLGGVPRDPAAHFPPLAHGRRALVPPPVSSCLSLHFISFGKQNFSSLSNPGP